MNRIYLTTLFIACALPRISQATFTEYEWVGWITEIVNESSVELSNNLAAGNESSGTFGYGSPDIFGQGFFTREKISLPDSPFFDPLTVESGTSGMGYSGFPGTYALTPEASVEDQVTPQIYVIQSERDYVQLHYRGEITTPFDSTNGTDKLLTFTFIGQSGTVDPFAIRNSLPIHASWDEMWAVYDYTDADSKRLQIVYQLDSIAVIPETSRYAAILSISALAVILIQRVRRRPKRAG